ncbi:MAG TPA: acetylxylan esterase [Candidatus Hydrogenedentes bacterium]|nr:acetylxylan esterase [Candidatus Hydrogenedentota bacterium]HPG69486.1 acetylxylan esterase [Candidatus Hydrogenedentota bacterium]
MGTLAAAVLFLVAGGVDVIWMDAREIPKEGAVIAESGEYTIWAWGPGGEALAISVGGETVQGDKPAKPEPGYAWAQLGTRSLDKGQVPIVLPDNVAGVVLTKGGAFSPAEAMKHRRVTDAPEAVADRRADTAKHTDTVFTMPDFRSVAEWEAFAASLRRRILLSSGLVPLPERNPLNAVISGRVAHDDYTVEKVYFESRPGFLVTGNLYRPVGDGPFPGVACPHGHWKKGRVENTDIGSIPGRCITLARMGCVAFSYDMVGYLDSCQFADHHWVSDVEKLWGVHPFAMQLWNSFRVVDFLQSLPDVDPERIACTGASGGGTQTFSLMAVDPRVKVAAPVNMISCSMQGGCICENAPILRMANSNQEIGALMAPRPLLMVSATGDWTRETPRIEYPAIRSIYTLYDAAERVANVHVDSGHNYNQSSREAVYRFFGKWLLDKGDKYAEFTEPAFEVESDEALRVFPDGPPAEFPSGDEVKRQTIAANRAKWATMLPESSDDLAAFRTEYGDVLEAVLGVELPAANAIAPERTGFDERDGYVIERWILRAPKTGAAVPAVFYRSRDAAPQDAVLLVHGLGKAALADDASDGPGPLVRGLMAAGKAVMTVDAFLLGEHHSPWHAAKRVREGQFMDTFQPTDTGYRVQDVLTALSYLHFRRDLEVVDLMGLGEAGLWCLFAGAIDERARNVIVDANRFVANDDQAWVDTYYIPCIRSVGDVATAIALTAPRALVLMNTGDAFLTDESKRMCSILDNVTVESALLDTAAIVGRLK